MKRKHARQDGGRRFTTISLRVETYRLLNEHRKGGESWDEFFRRTLKLFVRKG